MITVLALNLLGDGLRDALDPKLKGDTLALPTCSILSEKAFQDDPEEGFRIGAGPWILQEFVVNDYLSFTRFDDYHFGPVKTQKLRVRYIPEDSARAIALQTGEIDLCEHVVAMPFADSCQGVVVRLPT